MKDKCFAEVISMMSDSVELQLRHHQRDEQPAVGCEDVRKAPKVSHSTEVSCCLTLFGGPYERKKTYNYHIS